MGLYRSLFLDHWERINREAEQERALHPGFDQRPLVVLTVCALILVFQEYLGDRPSFDRLFRAYSDHPSYTLLGFAWWSGAKVVGYLLVPSLVVWLMGGRLRDYGFALPDAGKTLRIYLLLFGAIIPVVVAASFTRSFQSTYPFYRAAARSWGDFLTWELMYGATFVSLEFFFRGFMLFSLKRTMGAYAIFVAIMPYCMIHFHKPVTEVIGAIFAGIILGTVSMSTRSIWSGILVHVSVAWSMDALAMVQVFGWPGSGRVP
jgi:uncharacterized protein